MSSIVVRLVDRDGGPVSGRRVTLWWKGFMIPEGASDEYTGTDGEVAFDYLTDNWPLDGEAVFDYLINTCPGDQLAISVEGRKIKEYHACPEGFYEFTV